MVAGLAFLSLPQAGPSSRTLRMDVVDERPAALGAVEDFGCPPMSPVNLSHEAGISWHR